MEKYDLTNTDYEILKKLFTITGMIREIYLKLSELESTNKKDSFEYKNLVSTLSSLLQIEENIYRRIGKSPKKISDLLFYMLNYTEIGFNDGLNYIYHGLSDYMIKARISMRFERIINSAEFPKNSEDINKEEFCEINFDDVEIDEETFNSLTKIENVELQFKYMGLLEDEFQKDVINTILKILNEYIFNPHYIGIRFQLIQFKYLIAFTFKPVEVDFFAHDFEINSTLYWTSKMIIDSFNGNPEDLEVLKNSYSGELLYDQSDNLIELFDKDLKVPNNYAQAIISQIIIRASALFSSNADLQSFITFLKSELFDAKECNKELELIINASLEKLEEDRALPNVLSLKLEQ